MGSRFVDREKEPWAIQPIVGRETRVGIHEADSREAAERFIISSGVSLTTMGCVGSGVCIRNWRVVAFLNF